MNRSLYFTAIFFMLILWSSCRQDFDFAPSTGSLEFSKDTVYLDTVFSNIGSSTYNLKVYNTSNENDLFVIQNVKIDDAKITSGSTLTHVFSNFNELPNETGHTFTVTVSGITQAYITVRDIIKGFNRK